MSEDPFAELGAQDKSSTWWWFCMIHTDHGSRWGLLQSPDSIRQLSDILTRWSVLEGGAWAATVRNEWK
jgi:hypothetical protein